MKTSWLQATIATVLLALALPMAHAGDVPDSVKEHFRAQFPGTTIDQIRETPLPGIYELAAGQNLLYAAVGSPVVMLGHLYDTSKNEDLTQARLDELRTRRITWADLPLDDAIRSGSGKTKLAIFTDPDCPFCRKLEKELEHETGIETYRFLFPLASLHPRAPERTRRILCSKKPDAAYNDYVQKNKEPSATSDCARSAAVDRNIKLAGELGFSGTPVLVRADGAVLAGYRPIATLRAWLAQASDKEE